MAQAEHHQDWRRKSKRPVAERRLNVHDCFGRGRCRRRGARRLRPRELPCVDSVGYSPYPRGSQVTSSRSSSPSVDSPIAFTIGRSIRSTVFGSRLVPELASGQADSSLASPSLESQVQKQLIGRGTQRQNRLFRTRRGRHPRVL